MRRDYIGGKQVVGARHHPNGDVSLSFADDTSLKYGPTDLLTVERDPPPPALSGTSKRNLAIAGILILAGWYHYGPRCDAYWERVIGYAGYLRNTHPSIYGSEAEAELGYDPAFDEALDKVAEPWPGC